MGPRIRRLKYTKRYAGQFFKNTFSKSQLQFLIFFVTTRCDCRCGMCFYWREINKTAELSLSEIERISESIGNLRTLLLSGGEPFLRDDLPEVCRLFIEHNKISVLSIPTNCTQPKRIVEFSEKMLKDYPGLTLSINLSLDGFKETHDKIRRVSGVFDKVIETSSMLSELKKQYNNLEITVNTVITNHNISELEPFMDFVYTDINADYHDFELLRGDYKDREFALPPLSDIIDIHRLIVKNTERYLKKNKSGLLEKISVIGLLLLSQKIKERCLERKKPAFICSAGENIGVIDANGDVKLCELLPAVGNLREANYDFGAVWYSPMANRLRERIRNTSCNCTHVCFIKLTASRNIRSLFDIIYYYSAHKIKNGRL